MKRQIRRNVFETNSSSMHSLVVKKTSEYYNEAELRESVWLYDDGEWHIHSTEDLDFGRYPFDCLNTFGKKVRYAIASLCGYKENAKEVFENVIMKTVREVIPECINIKLPSMGYSRKENRKTYYGYVDEDILTGFLESENIDLKEFLTNKKYIVIVDGDEYQIWNRMKDSNLINENQIENEYPKREY